MPKTLCDCVFPTRYLLQICGATEISLGGGRGWEEPSSSIVQYLWRMGYTDFGLADVI
jgi:hypothetical protein